MPIYNFKCAKCGHTFSDLVSVPEKDTITCPKCSGKCETDWGNPNGNILIRGKDFYDSNKLR